MGFGSNKNQQRKGRWAKWEDDLLKSLVTELSVDSDDIDWSILEKHFDGMRDSKQIRERWVNHLTPSIKKRKFNEKEIQIIEDECAKHKFKWSKISKKIPYATPLMIKNFYNNRLKKKNPPTVRKSYLAKTTTHDEKLHTLASMADYVSHNESTDSLAKPKKPKKMSISSILNI
ncbi:2369_t:CDS:2 [Funneliformis geosporum]|uniref:2369_t:CDS:1 n=1 Tax=Funneliformis geosporum TaxID=1117311 RepID=A0A9W4SZP0_9GLOM|nr:2369_t:CDS:2 [Funneliformis geosporum]